MGRDEGSKNNPSISTSYVDAYPFTLEAETHGTLNQRLCHPGCLIIGDQLKPEKWLTETSVVSEFGKMEAYLAKKTEQENLFTSF